MFDTYNINMNNITNTDTLENVFKTNNVKEYQYCNYKFYNNNICVFNLNSVYILEYLNQPIKKLVNGENITLRVFPSIGN